MSRVKKTNASRRNCDNIRPTILLYSACLPSVGWPAFGLHFCISFRIITLKTALDPRLRASVRATRSDECATNICIIACIRIIFDLDAWLWRAPYIPDGMHGNAQETNPPGISQRSSIGFCTLLFCGTFLFRAHRTWMYSASVCNEMHLFFSFPFLCLRRYKPLMMDDRSTDFACYGGNEEPAKSRGSPLERFSLRISPRIPQRSYNERPCRTLVRV